MSGTIKDLNVASVGFSDENGKSYRTVTYKDGCIEKTDQSTGEMKVVSEGSKVDKKLKRIQYEFYTDDEGVEIVID